MYVYTITEVIKMESRLQKGGNSDGIRIPSSFLKALNLKTNDIVNIVQEEYKIIISVPKKKKISLKERFEKFNGTYENDLISVLTLFQSCFDD